MSRDSAATAFKISGPAILELSVTGAAGVSRVGPLRLDKRAVQQRQSRLDHETTRLTQRILRSGSDVANVFRLLDYSQSDLLERSDVSPKSSLVVPSNRADVGFLEFVRLASCVSADKVEQRLERE